MKRKHVKTMLAYYDAIPDMRRQFEAERRTLEDEYSGLRVASTDGVTHGTGPGNPTLALAERAIERNTYARIQEVIVNIQVLDADAAVIRACVNTLNGKYKRLLDMKYFRGYSWGKISVTMGTADSTTRYWHDRALERLGEVLDDAPMVGEILARASRARV